jgi:hypothetical protein
MGKSSFKIVLVYILEYVMHMRSFLKQDQLLTKKLILQGYKKLHSTSHHFANSMVDMIFCDYKFSVGHILNDFFHTVC